MIGVDPVNKKIIAIGAMAVLLILTAVLIAVNHRPGNDSQPEESNASSSVQDGSAASEISEVSAPFDFACSDRLCGYPETDRVFTDESIEVVFADAGTIRKEYGSNERKMQTGFAESSGQEINGMDVTLSGENGLIQHASWSYNGFTYTISINDTDNSVSVEEMTDYIVSTR